MKNLVRGASIIAVLSMCVVFIYANVPAGSTLAIANDSLEIIDNSLTDINNNLAIVSEEVVTETPEEVLPEVVVSETPEVVQSDDEDKKSKKLVKTTGSSKAAGAGASRGSFSATAYCLKGRTAMGHSVRRGIIAADPRVLKLGSKVVVNAGQWSGTYLVSDTGGAIKGKKLDIWVPNCSEARRFGRRTVQVFSPQ